MVSQKIKTATVPMSAPKAAKPARAKAMTKQDILAALVAIGLEKKQAEKVLLVLREAAITDLRDYGIFTLPDLIKIRVIKKGPTAERQSINPSTHQPMTVSAKPARQSIKVVPLKKLKDDVLTK